MNPETSENNANNDPKHDASNEAQSTTVAKNESANDKCANIAIDSYGECEWFIQVVSEANNIKNEYFERLKIAQENQEKEINGALLIESYFRMFVEKSHLNVLNRKAIIIQRLFRGYIGRKRFKYLSNLREIEWQKQKYSRLAILIQKIFRGYHSRKYILDFYARKAYIKQIETQSNILLNKLNSEYQIKRKQKEIENKQQSQEKFKQITQNLHHILSTKSCMGIFASPFGAQFNATAFGVPVETHIRNQFKRLYQEKLEETALTLNKTKLKNNLNHHTTTSYLSL